MGRAEPENFDLVGASLDVLLWQNGQKNPDSLQTIAKLWQKST